MATVASPVRKHPAAICEECPLKSKPCAPSLIPDNPVAAVVARSPGWKEAKTGVPFTGWSGQVLDHLLKEQGIKREEVMLTNVILCAPDEGPIPGEAIKACSPRLETELEDAGIDLVIAAGSEAVNLLIGRGAIDRYRGYRIQQERRTVIATNNPALVLRDASTFPNLVKDFKRAFNPIPEPTLPLVEVIEDDERAIEYIRSLKKGYVAVDTETRGGLTHRATLVTLQFATDGGHATVIGERECDLSKDGDILRELDKRLKDRGLKAIYHNGKFDIKILRTLGVKNARVDEDTMLMSYDCDERTGQTDKQHGGYHKLEYLLSEEFGWPDYEPETVKKFKKTGEVTDYDELYRYAGWDAAGTFQLFELLSERVRDEGTERPYRELLIPGVETCTKIELAGFRYDVRAAADVMEDEVAPELNAKRDRIRLLSDEKVSNPRSTKQMSALFYDDWKLTHEMVSRPGKARSTDESALNEVKAGRFTTKMGSSLGAGLTTGIDGYQMVRNFATEVDRFRELVKQADTYIIALIERALLDPEHRLFTDILLHGTTSGRTSSRNPNLQNITRTKAGLPDIRRLFLASPGRLIVSADYSQAELRCIAQFSGDPELNRIYREDLDLHSIVAERFYGADFTAEERVYSKIMNFGVAYGQGAATFQEKNDIPEAKAQAFIDWWWEYFGGVKEWKKEIIKEMKTGRVHSPWGRVRRFHLLTPENYNAAVREAVNFKPQSTAGDATLKSCILLAQEMDWKRGSIVITVHDSIVGDIDEDYVDEWGTICRQIMESRMKDDLQWDIPFKIDIGSGLTWADAK